MPLDKAVRIADRNSLSANLFLLTDKQEGASTGNARELDHLASVTKTYTAICFLSLEDSKDLRLEDMARKYLPKEMKKLGAEDVTLLDLLTHTTGIHDYYQHLALSKSSTEQQIANHPGWDFGQALNLALSGPRKKLKNQTAEYSFTNYLLLDKILESFGGFESVLKQRVLTPMNLQQTFLLTNQNPELFEKASPLSFGRISYRGFNRMASLGAEGALIASQRDVALFMRGAFEDSVTKNTKSRLTQRVSKLRAGIKYGVGVMLLPKFISGRKESIGHFGATGSAVYLDTTRLHVAALTTNQFQQKLLPPKLLRSLFSV